MTEKRIDASPVHEFVNSIEHGTKITIAMHDTPDPDAMGAAVGMQYLFKHLGFPSQIVYSGDVSHPQNRTLVNVLNLTFNRRKSSQTFDGDAVVCVDGTEKNSTNVTPALVIDHHKNETNAKFQIIDPSYGACSTIVYQLMREIMGDEWPAKEGVGVFTTLLLGIRTDTNDLVSENMTINDFNAYQDLLQVADKESLQKVMNYPLPRYLYDHRLSLHQNGNSHEANGTFVGGIGFIPSGQRDAIAVLAEEYARMETVNTSVIFAIIDRSTLQVSVRSSNVSLDVGSMCTDIFGDNGGGTSFKGGASIPLLFYGDLENGEKEKFWDVTCKHMFRKVLQEAFNEEATNGSSNQAPTG